MLEEKGEEAGKYAPKGVLRALIITPTRELALQVFIIVLWLLLLAIPVSDAEQHTKPFHTTLGRLACLHVWIRKNNILFNLLKP